MNYFQICRVRVCPIEVILKPTTTTRTSQQIPTSELSLTTENNKINKTNTSTNASLFEL